jgi:Lrp/AsnC family transcriptional regulator for asnA, asnC and gidA
MKDKLDTVDYTLLKILSECAQMPFTEVAKKANISPGTVHMRIKKMKDLEIINGATLSIDYAKMDWNLTMFLGIFLKEIGLYKLVIEQLKRIPEVVQINHTTGKYDIFVKMHAKDSEHYRQVYQNAILTISGISAIESFISIEENVNRHISFDTE